jgi:hypothetical protein
MMRISTKQKDSLEYDTCWDKPTSSVSQSKHYLGTDSQSKHYLGTDCCWNGSISLGTDLSVTPRNTRPLPEFPTNGSEHHKGAQGAFLHERIRVRIREPSLKDEHSHQKQILRLYPPPPKSNPQCKQDTGAQERIFREGEQFPTFRRARDGKRRTKICFAS